MVKLQFKKGHKKAFIISIVNLYSLALLWLVSGAISFEYIFHAVSDLFYFMLGSIVALMISFFIQNRNPINLYLEVRDVLISKLMLTISIFLFIILFYGKRGENGIDFHEITTIIFSLMNLCFIMTFLFKASHTGKWYDGQLNKDKSHFLD